MICSVFLSISLSRSVSLLLSCSLALALRVKPRRHRLSTVVFQFQFFTLNLTVVSCPHVSGPNDRLWVLSPLSFALTLSLVLSLSRSLAFVLSLFRSRSSCLRNKDGIDGSCRLMLREQANWQWRLQRPMARCMRTHQRSSFLIYSLASLKVSSV